MKIVKKVIIIVLLVFVSIGLLVIGNGYDMYKSALKQTPLLDKIENIKQKANYTTIEEVPQIYLNHVLFI